LWQCHELFLMHWRRKLGCLSNPFVMRQGWPGSCGFAFSSADAKFHSSFGGTIILQYPSLMSNLLNRTGPLHSCAILTVCMMHGRTFPSSAIEWAGKIVFSVTSFTDGICSPLIWTQWDRSRIMQNGQLLWGMLLLVRSLDFLVVMLWCYPSAPVDRNLVLKRLCLQLLLCL
jgi:hypothetical protein